MPLYQLILNREERAKGTAAQIYVPGSVLPHLQPLDRHDIAIICIGPTNGGSWAIMRMGDVVDHGPHLEEPYCRSVAQLGLGCQLEIELL